MIKFAKQNEYPYSFTGNSRNNIEETIEVLNKISSTFETEFSEVRFPSGEVYDNTVVKVAQEFLNKLLENNSFEVKY